MRKSSQQHQTGTMKKMSRLTHVNFNTDISKDNEIVQTSTKQTNSTEYANKGGVQIGNYSYECESTSNTDEIATQGKNFKMSISLHPSNSKTSGKLFRTYIYLLTAIQVIHVNMLLSMC